MARWRSFLGMAFMASLVHSLATTDSIQDADPPQSGYLPNHNINPSNVANSFTTSWTSTYNNLEVLYAKPLVYTPSGAPNEYVITVSNQNIVRIHDGLTGAVITSRTLDPPFASSDTNCGDIPNTVGITGTPIIDPSSDVMYFFSKGYKNGQAGPQGTINGAYKFYAVHLPSLADATGFPISLEGHAANNDKTRYFVGGTVLNRPGLAAFGNTVVGGFGGHCDNFNYTGMLVAVSKVPGVGVTNIQAMEASPGAPSPQTLDITVQGGGKAGIWQSGMGLAADTNANRVFFVTGNARGSGQNGGANGKPASGKVYLSTLEQAACNFAVDPSNGLLTQSDYFEPYGYDGNNGGDTDFGSSGIALLDPNTFYGTGVSRMAVAGGKDGLVYILNADNLGGFAGGASRSDNVIQTITDSFALLGGAGSYPGEGGYIYLSPASDSLYAWKFQRDGAGNPSFSLAGKSALTFAGKSVPTVTSLNGQPGTAIVWLADVNRGLVAYNAVPVNGVLQQIVLPAKAATGGLTKYQRAVFGNGRVYVARANSLIALGPGQAQTSPLTCTPNPVAFGSVMILDTLPITVTCKANTAVSITSCTTGNPVYQCGSASLPSTVASGQSFTFPVTFNLSDAALLQYENQTGAPLSPGSSAGTLSLSTTAQAPNYLPSTVIPLSATVVANGGYLVANLIKVNFGGVPLGSSSAIKQIVLSNKGSSSLTFSGFAFQDYYAPGMPYQNVSVQGTSLVGNGYTASQFPAVGSTLAAGSSLTIPLTFRPSQSTGIYVSYLNFWSDGGYTDIQLQGIADQATTTSTSTSSTSTHSTSTHSTSTISTTKPSTAKPSTAKPSTSSTTSTSSRMSTLTTEPTASPTTFKTSTTSLSSSTVSLSACPVKTAPAGNLKTFNWNIGWVNAAPDGYTRPFIGINGQWPCPPLNVNIGDKVKINVVNSLVNETTAIHFHGIFQRNTTYADGPAMVTQCPIQPGGGTFVYEFTVNQPGTYWYHAHIGGQYVDGLRGPLIIHDAAAPYQCNVDQEIVMTVSDLYHQQTPNLISFYQSPGNSNNNQGAEPVPDSALINEQQNVQFPVVAGKSYLFRIINMGAFAPHYIQFDQHSMTVVEVDGVYTQPYTVNQLFVAVAQRYSVIVHAKATTNQNFAIVSSMSKSMFNPSVTPADLNTDVTAWLVYNSASPLPSPFTIQPQPFDDSQFIPWDQQPLLGPVTLPIALTVDFGPNDQNQMRGMMNGVTYIPQKVPTLYTVLSAPANQVNNPAIYGVNSNPFVLPFGAIVEVTLNNHDGNGHPFHLHGHNFQVVSSYGGGTQFPYNPPSSTVYMRRDTAMLPAYGSVTLRFKADNPGVSLFHCHIEWHVEAGLTATFIEAPTELQAMKPYIPVSHRDACAAQKISMKGNAAGNTADFTNVTGANIEPGPNPWGALVIPGPQPS